MKNRKEELMQNRINYLEKQCKRKDEEITSLKLALEVYKQGENNTLDKASELVSKVSVSGAIYKEGYEQMQSALEQLNGANRMLLLWQKDIEKKYEKAIDKSIKNITKTIEK